MSVPDDFVPRNLSDRAQAYYRNASGAVVPPDLDDVAALAAFRQGMDDLGQPNVDAMPFEYSLEDDEIGGVPVLRIKPERPRSDTHKLIHLHGGGYIVGSPRGNASIPIQVAHDTGLEVVSVDYRLAPEYPYPAALDDALAVYRNLCARYVPAKVGVFGESAGGGLTAALALALRDAGETLPGALVLIAPFADLTGSGESITTNDGRDPDLNWESLRVGAEAYVGTGDPRDPLVSPVFADFAGFPPTLIQAGAREILLSDAERLAAHARDAGVAVQLEIWKGLWHCFHFDPGLPEARDACKSIAEFLLLHL